jgi:biotin transport system substrate-specific component
VSTAVVAPRTLADTISLPRLSPVASDVLRIVTGTAMVALLAQVSLPLPFTPVPLTGQTLGVLLCGTLLGTRRGTASLALYLAAGAVGLPVFASGGAGTIHLFGPTAGYLWAFPLAALLVGWLAERGWDRRLLTSALAMALGSLLLLTLGSLWLSLYVGGIASGFQKGMLPFLPVELVKIAIAAGLLPALWSVVRQRR